MELLKLSDTQTKPYNVAWRTSNLYSPKRIKTDSKANNLLIYYKTSLEFAYSSR